MSVAVLLALAGCAGQAAPSAVATGQAPGDPENCRDFTSQVTVGGQPQQAVGRACQQPDGSWQVTLNTPGLPQQVYTLPPQAMSLYGYADPYYWEPWFYGGPYFVGGPVFVARGFHHFHHGGGFHHFHHGGGFHGGFHGGHR